MPDRVLTSLRQSNLIRPHQNHAGKHPETYDTFVHRCGVVMVEAAGIAPASWTPLRSTELRSFHSRGIHSDKLIRRYSPRDPPTTSGNPVAALPAEFI